MRRSRVLLLGGLGLLVSAGVITASRTPAARTSSADRSMALGVLFDTAPSTSSIDRGLAIAEALRKKYGIDTSDPVRDRKEAAARAQREILNPLVFDETQIAAMATELGYSLDPQICANACGNVRELAVLELKKKALTTVAASLLAGR